MIHQPIQATNRGCGPTLRVYVPIAMANNPQTGKRTIAEQRVFNDALQVIIKALKPMIQKQIARKRLLDHQEDAVQAAYIAIIRALSDFDPSKAQFHTHFMWKLNEQLKRLDEHSHSYERRQDQRRRIEPEELDEGFSNSDAYAVGAETIEDSLEETLSERNLRQLLAVFQTRASFLAAQVVDEQSGQPALSNAEIEQAVQIMRQCLVMRDLEQRSFEEIFDTLGISRGRVKIILDYMHKEMASIARTAIRESAACGVNLLQSQEHMFWQQQNQRQSRKILNLIAAIQEDVQQQSGFGQAA